MKNPGLLPGIFLLRGRGTGSLQPGLPELLSAYLRDHSLTKEEKQQAAELLK